MNSHIPLWPIRNIFREKNRLDVMISQGLLFKDENTLIQSGGLYGNSTLRYISIPNLTILKEYKFSPNIFAEGCDLISEKNGDFIYQLTWREKKV